jgi:uncharacterized protein (DUF1778 family)
MEALEQTRSVDSPMTKTISMRVPPADLAEIDRRANDRGKTRTEFVLETVLKPDLAQTDTERRLSYLERQFKRVLELHVLA